MIAAAAITPFFSPPSTCDWNPYGMNGSRFEDWNALNAITMNTSSAITFTMTRMPLTVALSRAPTSSIAATANTMTAAGTLNTPPASGPCINSTGSSIPTDLRNPTA